MGLIIIDEDTLLLSFAMGMLTAIGFMLAGYAFLVWSYRQQFKLYMSQTSVGYHDVAMKELEDITDKLESLASGSNTRFMKMKYHDFLNLLNHLKKKYMNT